MLTLRPSVYETPNQVVAYEVDGLPAGQRAGLVLDVTGEWEVVWAINQQRRVIRGHFLEPEAALAALAKAADAATRDVVKSAK
jgi:hypothetical protein